MKQGKGAGAGGERVGVKRKAHNALHRMPAMPDVERRGWGAGRVASATRDHTTILSVCGPFVLRLSTHPPPPPSPARPSQHTDYGLLKGGAGPSGRGAAAPATEEEEDRRAYAELQKQGFIGGDKEGGKEKDGKAKADKDKKGGKVGGRVACVLAGLCVCGREGGTRAQGLGPAGAVGGGARVQLDLLCSQQQQQQPLQPHVPACLARRAAVPAAVHHARVLDPPPAPTPLCVTCPPRPPPARHPLPLGPCPRAPWPPPPPTTTRRGTRSAACTGWCRCWGPMAPWPPPGSLCTGTRWRSRPSTGRQGFVCGEGCAALLVCVLFPPPPPPRAPPPPSPAPAAPPLLALPAGMCLACRPATPTPTPTPTLTPTLNQPLTLPTHPNPKPALNPTHPPQPPRPRPPPHPAGP